MNNKTFNFGLGLWYIAIYPNEDFIRFQFIGGNPPMGKTEQGDDILLDAIIKGSKDIIPDDNTNASLVDTLS